jgi:hypothetical protein
MTRAARQAGGWLVWHVHGVGGGETGRRIDRDVHERFLDALVQNERVWVQPFLTVASWIRRWQRSAAESGG